MFLSYDLALKTALVFHLSLSCSLCAAEESLSARAPKRRGYVKGDLVPLTCLNRTVETGEHITDAHGNLQYISFPICNETSQPLSFEYLTPKTQTCTIDLLPDDLYHLIEFFVHSDVPLTCRVPSYPLDPNTLDTVSTQVSIPKEDDPAQALGAQTPLWTPFTIALQGTLQLSHLHLHTNINVLFHTSLNPSASAGGKSFSKQATLESHIIASAAYSLPVLAPTDPDNITPDALDSVPLDASDVTEGIKVLRNEPLVLTFNIAWVDGSTLPGSASRPITPMTSIRDHSIGFSLFSLSALAASAGIGAIVMLVYERRKNRKMGGLPVYGVSGTINGMGRSTGYGGYGGYGGYTGVGKRD